MAAYKVGLGVNDDRVYCWNQLTANRNEISMNFEKLKSSLSFLKYLKMLNNRIIDPSYRWPNPQLSKFS